MALSRAISAARRQTATRENRERQHRAECRLDEIVKTAGIADDYMDIDRRGDLDIETHFGRMWNAATTEEMRTLIARTFAAWQRDERAEEDAVRESVGGAVSLLKANNDLFIHGAYVPAESEGAA